MSASPSVKARAQVGVAVRTKNRALEVQARRDLAAAKIEAYVQKVVAEAPPLTSEQRARLAALLNGGAA